MRWQIVLLGLLAGLGFVGSLRAAEESDGHQRAVAEMLKLLEAGDYKAIAQADAMYARWRDEYAGAEPPQMTASGKWDRPWDPKVRYLCEPPTAVNEGAKRMAAAPATRGSRPRGDGRQGLPGVDSRLSGAAIR